MTVWLGVEQPHAPEHRNNAGGVICIGHCVTVTPLDQCCLDSLDEGRQGQYVPSYCSRCQRGEDAVQLSRLLIAKSGSGQAHVCYETENGLTVRPQPRVGSSSNGPDR